MINEGELKELCKINNIIYKIKNEIIYLDTTAESWYLKQTEDGQAWELWHKNKDYNRNNYHFQKNCISVKTAIKYVNAHKYKYGYKNVSKKSDRLNYLFNLIENNRTYSAI